MSKRIFANLIGNWIDITNNATVEDHQDTLTYFNEKLKYDENSYEAECFKYDYVNVQYKGINYRIHPSQIQILNDIP